MSNESQSKGNLLAIGVCFALFFMIAFVTNFAGAMGPILKTQFGASNMASQLGSAANFFAYFFMGIPGGLILKRKGYKFTSLLAAAVGFLGVGVQLAAAYCGKDSAFSVYVAGAFIAGFSMCLLNLVVNPLLNTLGGGGNKGNQLVQFGCSLNSIGATLSPMILGWLVGGEISKAHVGQAVPALVIAMAIFTYIVIESGIPNMAMLYMTTEQINGVANPAYVGSVVAGSVCGAYWFCMMLGRLAGGALGAKISSRVMISVCAVFGIALMLAAMFLPVEMVSVCGKKFPMAMCAMALCGLCTSVMWGGIFNMAAEGLGKYVPMGSGIFMAMVVGGLLLPLQGFVADKFGILNSYWMTIGLFAYVLFYALIGSRVSKRADA